MDLQKLEDWKKFSLMGEPGCFGDYDKDDPICMHCARATRNEIRSLKEKMDHFKKSFLFSIDISSCEEEKQKIELQKKNMQEVRTRLDEEQGKISELKIKISEKEKELEAEKLEIEEQGKKISAKAAFLADQKMIRTGYCSEAGNAVPVADTSSIPSIERLIPPIKEIPSSTERLIPVTERAVPATPLPKKEDPKSVIDFTKMGRVVFHTEHTGMGIRKLDDNGLDPDIASVEKTVPEFPQGCYYPIDIISQKDVGENLILEAIINFDGTVRRDPTQKNGTGILISVRKKIQK